MEIIPASETEKPVLRRLLELYGYDFSEIDGRDVDEHGEFGYRYLDHYWTDPDRHAFLVRVDSRWAGFVLVRTGDMPAATDIAEFFILRKYRRSGLGREVARQIFNRFPGKWQTRQVAGNSGATQFWHSAIPVEFYEELLGTQTVQRFEIQPPPT
ncbi:MAG TPA: GNAT family N-acetyltransferase [Mycobacteriales bacterium]|jgi:predicted acetyltransferase|nr:GNAT family N-acetyltransferase [Mycobacteriales bacterium]